MRIAPVMLIVACVATASVFGQSLSQRIADLKARHAADQAAAANHLRQSAVGQELRSGLRAGGLADVTARDAVAYLSTVSGLSIVVPWPQLQQAGIDPEQHVTITGGITVAAGIDQLVKQLSPEGQVIWEVNPWYVEVMTKEAANRRLVTAIYPIGDLLTDVPNFTDAPQMDLTAILSNGSSDRTLGGGGGGGSSAGLLKDNTAAGATATTPAERGQKIADLVRQTIEPEVWREAGGPASITYYNGNLIVRAPAYVQRQIGGGAGMVRGTGHAMVDLTEAPAVGTPRHAAAPPVTTAGHRSDHVAGIAPTLTWRH